MRLSVVRALWQELTDLHGDKILDSGAPVVTVSACPGRSSWKDGGGRGASRFCPTPSTPFANQYLEQLLSLWVSHFPRFQAKCRQVISSEPCTRSGIER